jgi:diguanylate cyclase (GGDEF)-like protein
MNTLYFVFILVFGFSFLFPSQASQTQEAFQLLRLDEDLSLEQKIIEYKGLVTLENKLEKPNTELILKLYEAMMDSMYDMGGYDQVTRTFNEIDFYSKINDQSVTASNYYLRLMCHTANAFLMLQKYDAAKNLLSSISDFRESHVINDANKAYSFNSAGQFFVRTGQYKDGLKMLRLAMVSYEKSTSLSDVDKRKKLSATLGYVGNTYYTIGDYKNAIKYFEASLDKIGSEAAMIDTFIYNHNIASAYLSLSQWDVAITKAKIAATNAKEMQSDMFLAYSNEIIARSMHGLGKSNQAINLIEQSISVYEQLNDSQKIVETLGFNAQFQISLGLWEKALQSIKQAHQTLGIDSSTEATLALYEASFLLHEHNKEYEDALFYHKAFASLQAADFETKLKQEAQRLMLDFELGLAEHKASKLAQENQMKSIIIDKNESENRFLWLVIGGSAAVLILLLYGFYRERSIKLEMEILAMTDALTACPNRRNIMLQAKNMLIAQASKTDSLAIALIDVDNFKFINDTYGHDIGDEVLKNLTSIITNNLRNIDVLGRYGGEEFIVLLPSANEKSISLIFERIQAALKQHVCSCEGDVLRLPITISMGADIVNKIPKNTNDKEVSLMLNSIVKNADNTLYEAKKKGKDQLQFVIS